MPVIANLDEQVGTVLIESIAKQRAAPEPADGEKQPAARSLDSKRLQAAAERDSSLDSQAPRKSPIVPPLPVWLL